MTGKLSKASIRAVASDRRDVYKEVHYVPSGPIQPTLGGNVYDVHFIEVRIGKSDVKLFSNKGELRSEVQAYVSTVEPRFSNEGYRVHRLRCDNAFENIPNELREEMMKADISVHPSPSYNPEGN